MITRRDFLGEAAAFLEAAEKRYHGVSAPMKAWLKLQRGLIAFGDVTNTASCGCVTIWCRSIAEACDT